VNFVWLGLGFDLHQEGVVSLTELSECIGILSELSQSKNMEATGESGEIQLKVFILTFIKYNFLSVVIVFALLTLLLIKRYFKGLNGAFVYYRQLH
jgi:hypothetical protein